MNVALMGSVSSSLAVFEALLRGGVEVTGVLGLDESLAATTCDYRPLRGPAEASGLPFCSFRNVRERAVERFLRQHRPDLLWVIGLSQLVPNRLIGLARHGAVGFHPTPLPRGRGRAPVAWTILLDEPAAATLFFLTAQPDAGDIIMQRPVPVQPDDYSEDLIARTNHLLAEMVFELAPAIRAGELPRSAQDSTQATVYPRRTAADGRVDWRATSAAIYRLVRAAGRPYHGAFTTWQGKKLILWRARPVTADETGTFTRIAHSEPGVVLSISGSDGIVVRTGDGALILTEARFENDQHVRPADVLQPGNRMGEMQGVKDRE